MYFPYGDEKGMALPIALVFLALLTLASTTAIMSIIIDTKITANYKASVKAILCGRGRCPGGEAKTERR